MTSYIRNPLTYTWLFLAIATFVGWGLGSGKADLSPHADQLITVAILAIAVIKTRFVIRNYMEVRFAPTWLQLTCDAWLACVFATILSFYLSGL